MESEGKDREEETLQTAFKKLRVDAESASAAVHVCETTRTAARSGTEGAKSKMSSPKENWHGCMRKSSRGAVRSQRRRRSKSPILHPPKFTYCSSKMSPPPGHLKHKSPPESEDACASLGVPAKKELLLSGHSSPVFGATGYETHVTASRDGLGSPHLSPRPHSDEDSSEGFPFLGADRCPLGGTLVAAADPGAVAPASDFQSLSRLHENRACPCGQSECQCVGWQGMEVYSFSGLRNVISECERNLPGPGDASQSASRQRTQSSTAASGSPRSCSEQARAYVDDITIEDLSGYMEYYLYIPKKMSHMAEMMYT
ncbi:oxidative stress-responsive serine-rich protein 1 [Denticeps clupeoides]|uniref:Oxidative stress-responsive serine-rich protein 1 n=1 Tax=Denticeps clupeoides TaxID=299321 RepID=A0AAY4ET04_9TELE|nr:oxidative stress-responsive serine-rich protein 1 [Denticeps clupeoides]